MAVESNVITMGTALDNLISSMGAEISDTALEKLEGLLREAGPDFDQHSRNVVEDFLVNNHS